MALFLLGGDWWQHDELMALYPPGLGCLAESKTWRGGDSGGAAAGLAREGEPHNPVIAVFVGPCVRHHAPL